MATKRQVITAINKIIDNGNNTANTVRSVLNEIVNFAEENNTSNIKTFKNTINNKNYILNYSIKGIENEYINFTFQIECIEPTIKDFQGIISFEIEKDLMSFLLPILPNSRSKMMHPSFIVEVKNKDAKKQSMLIETMGITFRQVAISFALDEKNHALQIALTSLLPKQTPLDPTDFINSSIAIHHFNNL